MLGEFKGRGMERFDDTWELVEEYLKNPNCDLTNLLLEEIRTLKTALSFYAEGEHMCSSWYDRDNKGKYEYVKDKNFWLRGDRDSYTELVEDGNLAGDVINDLPGPLRDLESCDTIK